MVLDASCTLSLHVSMILVFYQAVQDLVSFCFIVQLILKETDKYNQLTNATVTDPS